MDPIEEIRSLLKDHANKSDTFRKEISDQMTEQNKSLANIEFVLMGNKKAGIDGIAHTVKKHEKYIAQDKKFKYIVGGISLAGTGTGFWTAVKSFIGI